MPRQLIEPHEGDKRYTRGKKGKFTKQASVGRSLAADRRTKATKVAKKSDGDRGDQKRSRKHKTKPKGIFSRLFGG